MQQAILNNPELFKGKIVLDIGCGSGKLSFFAVHYGATHVYAIDCYSIINDSQTTEKLNNVSDKFTLIKDRIDNVVLPVDYVDVIVSEWMGYCIFFDSMLDPVIFARDKWLRKDTGRIFPDRARLHIMGIKNLLNKKAKDINQPIVGVCDNE